MFQMDSVLSHILVQGEGDTFYRFSNADGKQWLMPARHMVVAMNLYQPSHWKGLLVKAGLPYLHGVGAVRRFLHTEPERCRLSDELYAILCRAFRVERLEFSLFGGTPGVHQKLTMQVSVGNRILGYGKLSDRPAIIDLFQREAELLDGLKQKGMTEVPEALFCGQLAGNIGLFVQSTWKTRHSQVPHRWSALHEDFLQKMYEATRQTLPFEQTDYYQTLLALQQHLHWLPEDARPLVAAMVERVLAKYAGREVDFALYHADFTPWNMFVEQGRLFVFDFEYARRTYPPLLDRYHFFTQTALFERKWGADELLAQVQLRKDDLPLEGYVLYLLDVISRFTIREQGKWSGDVAISLSVWLKLLAYFAN